MPRHITTTKAKLAASRALGDPWEEGSETPGVGVARKGPTKRCGKVCYPSERAALDFAHRVNKRRSERLRAYFCTHCPGWHLTSQTEGRGDGS